MSPAIGVVLRGGVYWLVVFAAGFLLGIVRILWLEPRIGARWAELAEMPVMLAVIWLAARFVTRKFPAGRRERLMSGAIALILLVGIELTVVLSLRGLTIGQYLESRDPVAGTAYLLMLLVFALMPALMSSPIRAR